MTERRYAHSFATPALTPDADDRPAPACLGNPEPFDVLMDVTSGREFEDALRDAREMCARCPLFSTCLRDNRGEQWAKAILTAQPAPRSRTDEPRKQTVAACGTQGGYYRHIRGRGGKPKTTPCDACKAAHREEEAKRVARRKELAA